MTKTLVQGLHCAPKASHEKIAVMEELSGKIATEVSAVRTGVGLWLRGEYTFIRFTGPDAASWLHSQTTNDAEALESGQGQANAVLDRQGRLQGHFTLHRWDDEYWMIVERSQAAHLIETLDAHLFIEDVQMEETGGELDQLVVQGPDALNFLAKVLGTDESVTNDFLPRELHGVHPVEILGFEALAFRASPTGEDGYVFVLERGDGALLLEKLQAQDDVHESVVVDTDAQEILRIEAGIPKFGTDIDSTCVIPETTLERDCISYEKGCYIGQEVVARLKAYGSVKRALMGLVFQEESFESSRLPLGISVGGKRVGTITSLCFSPTLNETIALAYLDREHRTPNEILEATLGEESVSVKAEVRVLPFYQASSRDERSSELYDEALDLFQKDHRDEDDTAIHLLKQAILLSPSFEDAYEVLGVILHRQGRTDEAIHFMQLLAGLNPDCIMAHTNLSVFFVAKGMIQEAEEEKAKAGLLEIQKFSDDQAAKQAAEHERQRLEEDARQRIGMFEEVLEIDPDDAVATFGLGKAYVQLGQYKNAVPFLLRATEVQKDFSAAYLDLGKCHEFLGHRENAVSAFREGIAVASRKGDLMPMREMERRLKALTGREQPASN